MATIIITYCTLFYMYIENSIIKLQSFAVIQEEMEELKNFLIFLIILICYNQVNCKEIERAQVLRVKCYNKRVNKLLDNLAEKHVILILKVHLPDVDIYVPHDVNVKDTLKHKNIEYQILIDDYDALYEFTKPFSIESMNNSKDPDLDFEDYYGYSIIVHYLNHLYIKFPQLIKLERISVTYDQNPVVVVQITNGRKNNPAIWIDGGISGREWITSTSILFIINEFVHNYKHLPDSIKNIDWYFVPMLNPDSYEYSRNTFRLNHKNRHLSKFCLDKWQGVDLNRNFGSYWNGPDASADPCSENHNGISAFSEPETQGMRDFIVNNQNRTKWTVYLTFRSYGQNILYPWNYLEKPPENVKQLKQIGELLAQSIKNKNNVTYTVKCANELSLKSGVSSDWALQTKLFNLAYTIELRDTGTYGFLLPVDLIKPTARDALVLVTTLAEIIAKNNTTAWLN